MDRAVHDTLEMLESIHGKHEGVTGVPTGFRDLDNLTGGWQKSDLIIIAGRPSCGENCIRTIARGKCADAQEQAHNDRHFLPGDVYEAARDAAPLCRGPGGCPCGADRAAPRG